MEGLGDFAAREGLPTLDLAEPRDSRIFAAVRGDALGVAFPGALPSPVDSLFGLASVFILLAGLGGFALRERFKTLDVVGLGDGCVFALLTGEIFAGVERALLACFRAFWGLLLLARAFSPSPVFGLFPTVECRRVFDLGGLCDGCRFALVRGDVFLGEECPLLSCFDVLGVALRGDLLPPFGRPLGFGVLRAAGLNEGDLLELFGRPLGLFSDFFSLSGLGLPWDAERLPVLDFGELEDGDLLFGRPLGFLSAFFPLPGL